MTCVFFLFCLSSCFGAVIFFIGIYSLFREKSETWRRFKGSKVKNSQQISIALEKKNKKIIKKKLEIFHNFWQNRYYFFWCYAKKITLDIWNFHKMFLESIFYTQWDFKYILTLFKLFIGISYFRVFLFIYYYSWWTFFQSIENIKNQ